MTATKTARMTGGAAMVEGFMSSLPPLGTSALAAEDEERARQLFRMALAKQRSGWGMHQVPTEIGRATFIELIQQLVAGTARTRPPIFLRKRF